MGKSLVSCFLNHGVVTDVLTRFYCNFFLQMSSFSLLNICWHIDEHVLTARRICFKRSDYLCSYSERFWEVVLPATVKRLDDTSKTPVVVTPKTR